MREIKFRAWNKEMKYMSPVEQLNEMKSVLIYIPEQSNEDGDVEWDVEFIPMEKVELMQFTGLKDKSGKEIYEGDIVKSWNIPKTNYSIREIRWGSPRYAGFYLCSGEHNLEALIDAVCEAHIEIIGNIYQNPDLLK